MAVAVAVEEVTGGAPAVLLTITGLGIGDSLVSVWRTADGVRSPVRGARRVLMVDASAVTDYDVPLGRPVTYEVEVISGPDGASRTTSEPVIVDEGGTTSWIMDPLDPTTAVPILRKIGQSGGPIFMVSAMRELEYAADVSMIKVMGSDRPMVQMGKRAAAQGVDISLITDTAEQNTRVRQLFMSGGPILVRVPPSVSASLDGSCFMAAATVGETSRKPHTGNELTTWKVSGDTVAAPVLKVLTTTFTYGDVAILFSTYQQKQDALASGATYLDDLKSPFG